MGVNKGSVRRKERSTEIVQSTIVRGKQKHLLLCHLRKRVPAVGVDRIRFGKNACLKIQKLTSIPNQIPYWHHTLPEAGQAVDDQHSAKAARRQCAGH